MSDSDKVRFSRDGDQFHYLWAARRCLRLLSATSGLIAITIEGASAAETADGEQIEAGEELIDVGEYYGHEAIEQARFIRYMQLKHSTQRAAEPWTASGLERTIRGFAARYQALQQRHGVGALAGRLEFGFLSNRPISFDFREAIEDAATETSTRHPRHLASLQNFTGLQGSALAAFCRLLRLDGEQAGFLVQRGVLALETKAYLPGDDVDAPVQLKELVTRKASSEGKNDPTITKIDVMRALGTTEDKLFPAPSRIETAENSIPRAQESDLVARIIAARAPVLIHAAAGVGKSILSQRIGHHLPGGSICVTYDCFGNGEYRRVASPRHRHKDALVQIANELATLGLCDPLIPSSRADNSDYLKAFMHRLRQGASTLRATNGDALLCVAIDAADNAEMAALEFGGERSFARDLLQEPLVDGLRLVAFCRPERQHLLGLPPTIVSLELAPFSRDETAALLRASYPHASENDVAEFHRLTSQNPRLQATALAQPGPLPTILRSLGPNPGSVNDAIASLLESAIANVRQRSGAIEQPQIDIICAALATLRPLIPVPVLAAISGVQASAIVSFATDLGRPLLIAGNAVQFRDEPVETWFRQRFKPDRAQLVEFISKLQPLAAGSAYVASTLPQLMLESGQLDALVDLALSSSMLPLESPIEKRDIELQRLQFALKASLRAHSWCAATKLSLKAAGETAGDTRQQKLLQANTDLAAILLEPTRLEEIVSRRTFGGAWLGAHHAYESGLLSHVEEFRGDSRSRLRMAFEWLTNWSRLPSDEREKEQIKIEDIAELAMAQLNLNGPNASVGILGRWKPRDVSFRASRVISQRLVDHGRYTDLDNLALAAGNDLCLVLGITVELRLVHRLPPRDAVDRALRLIAKPWVRLTNHDLDYKATTLQAVTALVEAGYRYGLFPNDILASALGRYLPEVPAHGIVSRFDGQRFHLLRAYCLRAALEGKPLLLIDLARPEVRQQMEKEPSHSESSDVREFKEVVGSLLPWHKLWAAQFTSTGDTEHLSEKLSAVRTESGQAARTSYRDDAFILDEVAGVWLDILIDAGKTGADLLGALVNWSADLRRPLFTPTWVQFARAAARIDGFQNYAHGFAQQAYKQTRDTKDHAESKADTYIDIARAILSIDRAEAREYLNQAVEVASKLGDEVLDRWQAMLDLAERSADPARPAPEAAYQLARCAELTYKYVARDKYFEWEDTVRAITDLCPASGVAILSRWRDREFGSPARLLSLLVPHMAQRGLLDVRAAVAFVGFRARWDYGLLLTSSLAACGSGAEKQRLLQHLVRYALLDELSASEWRDLLAGAAVHALTIPDVDQIIDYAEHREERMRKKDSGSTGHLTLLEEERDWDAIFAGLQLDTPEGISRAYSRFRHGEPPFYFEQLVRELFARLPIGREADALRAVGEVPALSLYDFRRLLEQVPETWKSRMAIQSALGDLVRRICSRYCMMIGKSRYYDLLSLELASRTTGVPEQELIEVILSALGRTTEMLEAARLFRLIPLLASKLSHAEALDALEFGLGLYDGSLDVSDGDGPWTPALMPPQDPVAAVAGYLWAALAVPEADLRWQAAHVVRGLCALDCRTILDHLVSLAKERSGGPFVDQRLHFYQWHARQWLVIGLARAAIESPATVSRYADFLIQLALHDSPHVFIRRLVAHALIGLHSTGHLTIAGSILDQLATVNVPAIPLTISKRYERYASRTPKQEDGAKRFLVGYDMNRYWFERLGTSFAKTAREIEIAVENVVWDDWGLTCNGHWDNDERARLGFFRDRLSSYSQGSYPKVDDLSFYLSYHAMMVSAGKLLATAPVHQDPDDHENSFEEWFKWHLLTRSDGRWLADRRDPAPLEWPSWKDTMPPTEDWRWSIASPDFGRVLGLGTDRISLFGRWVLEAERQQESVHIRSVLVSSNQSPALLRALQTVQNSYNCHLPAEGEDSEISAEEFQLKGWIADGNHSNLLDKFDPWGADIAYPPLEPARFVCDLMRLIPDEEHRIWTTVTRETPEEVLWSQLWGVPADDDELSSESGRRIQMSRAFLNGFLRDSGMDLIVKVELERTVRRYPYERYKDDQLGYVQPYFRVFLFGADGGYRTL